MSTFAPLFMRPNLVWEAKVDREDYHSDISMSGCRLRPMLALDYLKVPHRLDLDPAKNLVYHQPKLDGVRCSAGSTSTQQVTPFQLSSRKGLQYHLPTIEGAAKRLVKLLPGNTLALDGELYTHGVSLQKLIRNHLRDI